jgi:hypothetical protein
MRTTLFMPLLFLMTSLFAQTTDSLGIDNDAIPNRQEAGFLNSTLKDKGSTFNFINKKLAFVTGSSGHIILPKSEYFKKYVIPWIDKGSIPQIFTVRLTPEQKQKSGGYDAIVLCWVKAFSDKQKRKIVDQLAEQTKFSPTSNK